MNETIIEQILGIASVWVMVIVIIYLNNDK